MTEKLELIEAGPTDLPAVMSVMDAAFDPRFGEAWTLSQCAGLLPLPGVWMTLARRGGYPVGFSLSRFTVDEAELLLLGVRPSARLHGIGKSLLNHFIANAKDRGAERVHLEVRDGNAAIHLYQGAGFTVVGRRRNYYTGDDGEIFDALSLARSTSQEAPA